MRRAACREPAGPFRMPLEPPHDGFGEGRLTVFRRPAATDPVFAEVPEGGADVPMPELDRAVGAILQGRPQSPSVLGLVAVLSPSVPFQHREAVRDDQVVFLVRPWPSRHAPGLSAIGRAVTGIREGVCASRAAHVPAVQEALVRMTQPSFTDVPPGPALKRIHGWDARTGRDRVTALSGCPARVRRAEPWASARCGSLPGGPAGTVRRKGNGGHQGTTGLIGSPCAGARFRGKGLDVTGAGSPSLPSRPGRHRTGSRKACLSGAPARPGARARPRRDARSRP